jgi:hypothetical protein
MFAQARDHQFHNSNGDIMTVLFADDVSILLEVNDDEKTREFLALDVFSTKLHEKTFSPNRSKKRVSFCPQYSKRLGIHGLFIFIRCATCCRTTKP